MTTLTRAHTAHRTPCHNTAVEAKSPPRPPVPVMALLSFTALGTGLAIASLLGAR
jgi:hypothetical protein